MPRICVCITGQLRRSDDGLWKLKSVTAPHDTTFIFSVWDTVGSKIDGALNIDQVPRIFEQDAGDALPHRWLGYRNLWQALPVLYQKRVQSFEHHAPGSIRDRLTAVFPDAIIDIEAADLLQLEFTNPGEDKNSLRMLYKFWRANEIKRKIEKTAGKFDYVIRMRPDQILNFIDLQEIARHVEQNTILVDAFVPGGAFVYDNFAAGSSAALDAYCSLFGRAMAVPQTWDHIHRELHRHLETVGLNYARYSHLGGLAQDKRISAQDVEETLQTMRQEGEGWTRIHDISLAAMRMSAQVSAGDANAALRTLAAPVAIKDEDVAYLDGHLAASAKTYKAVKDLSLAAACLCVSMHLRHVAPEAWPAWAIDIIVEAIAEKVRLEPTSNIDGLARSILTTLDFSRIPFHDTLHAALGSLHDIAFEEIRGLMSGAGFQTRLIDALAAHDVYDACFSLVENFAGDAQAKHLLVLALKQGRAERAGDFGQAVACLQERLTQTPDDVQSIYKIADLLKELARYDEAERWQHRAIMLDPTHAGALRQMAEIYLHLGRIDQAADALARALQHDGSSSDAAFLKAYTAYRRGAADGSVPVPDGYMARPSFHRLPEYDRFHAGYARPVVTS